MVFFSPDQLINLNLVSVLTRTKLSRPEQPEKAAGITLRSGAEDSGQHSAQQQQSLPLY